MTTREEKIYEIVKDVLERFPDEGLTDVEWVDEFYETLEEIKAILEE
jgi:hypothetical protein